MGKESLRTLSVIFFIMGVLVYLVLHGIFGAPSPWKAFYAMMGLSALLGGLSKFAKSEKEEEWTCQHCQATLSREEIKFGLCPHCGTKVKGFRGVRSGSIFFGGL